jgi:hypothetical protein
MKRKREKEEPDDAKSLKAVPLADEPGRTHQTA